MFASLRIAEVGKFVNNLVIEIIVNLSDQTGGVNVLLGLIRGEIAGLKSCFVRSF